MNKLLSTFLLALSLSTQAGLPPTTSKVSSDSTDVTTFKFRFPNFTGTHSGTTLSLGVNSVAGGGTGLATLTANNVILGNGTSSPSFVAPGTIGNILTSNGTTWQSSALGTGTPQVTTQGATSPAIYSWTMAANGTVSNEFGDPVNGNCTNANPSVCTWTGSLWGSGITPNCFAIQQLGGGSNFCVVLPSTTTLQITCYADSGGVTTTSAPKYAFCHGTR